MISEGELRAEIARLRAKIVRLNSIVQGEHAERIRMTNQRDDADSENARLQNIIVEQGKELRSRAV
jgi:hypothetical protein